jgi:tetratricopeptide (TPR) repeat protein
MAAYPSESTLGFSDENRGKEVVEVLKRAKSELDLERFDVTTRLFKEALRDKYALRFSERAKALLGLGQAYYGLGDFKAGINSEMMQKALKAFKEAAESERSAESYYLSGWSTSVWVTKSKR